MSIKIDRFELKTIKETATVKIPNLNTILIKDHADERVVSFVQLFNDKKKNTELATRIIDVIENFILEEENNNDSEN